MHSFEPEIALRVGVNAAVLYQNIVWWSRKNAANGRHIMDGYAWTYNSRRAFADLFPYFSEKQIRSALDRLLEAGLLVKGEYNAANYDRTNWYAPAESRMWPEIAIGPTGPMDWPKTANGVAPEGQPIPDSKPVGKPVGKPFGDFDAFWAEVPRKVGRGAAEKSYRAALKKTDHDTLIAGIRRYAEERAGKDRQYTVHPATWLNQERWADEPERSDDFHNQIDALLRGNTNDVRREDAIDHGPRQPLLGGLETPRTSDDGNRNGPSQGHGGGYQQEASSVIRPRKFGGGMF